MPTRCWKIWATRPSGVNVSPPTAAAIQGDTEMAILLLDHGADPNASLGGMVTPLYSAAVVGDDSMIRLLMSQGAENTRPADPREMTPSEVAIRAGNEPSASLITQLSSGG